MRGFRFGALELVPSPLVQQDNVATAPKWKNRPRIQTLSRNPWLFLAGHRPGEPGENCYSELFVEVR